MDRNEKKIIFAAGSVYPYASPTGGICLDLARAFNKKEHVKIISSLTEYPPTSAAAIEGMELTVFYNWLYKMRFFFSGNGHFLYQFGLNCIRVIDRLNTLLFVPKTGWWYWRRVYAELKKELDTGQVKAVITFSEPFEAHWAARKLKQEGYAFYWIAFFADSFAIPNNKRNLFLSLDNMKNMEEEVLKNCDSYFVTPEIEVRCQDRYAAYAEKKHLFPYMIKDLVRPAAASHCGIRMVYAGRFYRGIRNPEQMLRTIVEAQVPGLRFDLYTKGDCEAIVRTYQEKHPALIRLMDMVQRDRLQEIYANADILVNMENKSHAFKPSKQYEYISTGKPILSFYYFEPDPVLKKYPLALQVRLGDVTERSASQIRNFLVSAAGQSLNYAELVSLFPHNTLDSVVKSMETIME